MENLLVILHIEDIAPARQVAETLDHFRVITFDPILLDRLLLAGLPAELVMWEEAPSFNDADKAAHELAWRFEERITPVVQRFVPGLSIAGWQHYNAYFLFLTLRWNSGIWPAMAEHLRGNKLFLFICDMPLAYYFNSFLPSSMLMAFANAEGIEIAPYTYGVKEGLTRLVPSLPEIRPAGDTDMILAHLPTCMYDIYHFNAELSATGKKVVNLKGKYFNMPVLSHETVETVQQDEMAVHLPTAWQERLPQLERVLTAEIDAALQDYPLLPFYRARQAAHVAQVYCAQLVMLASLDRHFQHSKPRLLVMADHDTDYHGPLIAFAQRHNLPVLYVPHSKTTSDIFFDYRRLKVLTHPIQGDVIKRPDGTLADQATLAFPEVLQIHTLPLKRIAKVGILLQAVSMNAIYATDMKPYLDGIRQLVGWCRDNGVAFSLRCKPSYFLISILENALQIPREELTDAVQMDMADYAVTCDLCLMYDAPTSAEIDFIARGVPVLNPVIKDMTNVEAMVADTAIIPRAGVTQTLRTATALLRDPAELDRFRRRQFAAYVVKSQDALPLRRYLGEALGE